MSKREMRELKEAISKRRREEAIEVIFDCINTAMIYMLVPACVSLIILMGLI